MNVQESRQLKAGDKVRQSSNAKDTGFVIENSAENVLIHWQDGTRTLTAHAGMAHVMRVVEGRLGLGSLLKLAPVVALVLGFGFYQLKGMERDASPAAKPVVVQRIQPLPAKIDTQLATATTEEQWAALKQQEVK